MGFIYKITNKINGKIYIGKTDFSIEKRWAEHKKDSQKDLKNRPLYRAMNKYGIENFSIEVVEECQEDLSEREIFWISYYDSYNNGYNATLGGEGKSLIDYNQINELYEKGFSIYQIAQQTGHDRAYLSKILKDKKGLSKEQLHKHGMQQQERSVKMINKENLQIIKVFDSVAIASQYCIDNGLSKDTIRGISAHISQCCNGLRKTAYKHCWEYC